MDYNLERFITAQNKLGFYETALSELKRGKKQTHWMWFIFPQLKALGHSPNALFYGVSGLDEARAYLSHPVLRERYLACCEALLNQPEADPVRIMGDIDAKKLRSSLTLFLFAEDNPTFSALLDKLYGGKTDGRTVSLIKTQ